MSTIAVSTVHYRSFFTKKNHLYPETVHGTRAVAARRGLKVNIVVVCLVRAFQEMKCKETQLKSFGFCRHHQRVNLP